MLGLDERGGLGEVVNDESGLGISVVHGGERGESLLTGGIPDLKLDRSGREVAFLCQESGCKSMRYQYMVVAADKTRERELRQHIPPIVGSLFSWKSLLTNRKTSDDCRKC